MSKKLVPEKIYSLTPMQEGMLFFSLLNPEEKSYFEQTSIVLKGSLDIEAMERSLNVLVRRHDILRTIFLHEKIQKPRQVVVKEREAKIQFQDIKHLSAPEQEKFLNDAEQEDQRKGFQLDKDILIRVSIFQLSENTFKLIWAFHHIIMDGWSNGILLGEFFHIYEAQRKNQSIALPTAVPFKNYVDWIEKQDRKKAQTYWKEYLNGYDTVLTIPGAKKNKTNTFNLEVFKHHFSASHTKALDTLAKQCGVSLNAVFQTIWGVLLQKYAMTDDVVFGSVVSGRNPQVQGIDNMIGLFINSIAFRIQSNQDDSFKSLVLKSHQNFNNSSQYDFFPLAEAQNETSLKHDLINHILVFENFPIEEKTSETLSDSVGFTIDGFDSFEQTNYDLTVSIAPGNQLAVHLEYNALAYDAHYIEKIAHHLDRIVEQVIKQPELPLSEISIISQEDVEQLASFNKTNKEYDASRTFLDMFNEAVQKSGNEKAISFGADHTTYEDLNVLSTSIGSGLHSQGVQKGDIVPILADRNILSIATILGVLKVGAAYLPIDPSLPKGRIDFMIEDSGAKHIITSALHRDKIASGDIEVIDMDTDFSSYPEFDGNTVNADDLAYVIYTSGSTGKPKGVKVSHRSWANVGQAWKEEYELDKFSVNLLQIASFSFDVFAGDLMRTLANGGHLVVCPNDVKLDPESLYELINTNNINIFESTPGLLMPLMDYIYDNKLDVSQMELLILGSDTCKGESYNRLLSRFGSQMRIVNSYGVTEATIDSCYFESTQPIENAVTPIGKPLPNTQFYILDNHLSMQPIGVPGELCIAGEGLAQGYLNREDLTAERFIPNPFAEGEKLYRTGDLALWLSDGNVEFLGRFDHQVKIRGYRIELGEIETVLLKAPGIKDAIIIDHADASGDKILVAYCIVQGEWDTEKLKNEIGKELPEYMIPHRFVQLESIPLTSNGKVDRRALPNPFEGISANRAEYVAPSTEEEKKLASIWQEILSVDGIGLHDNFFELGGHSLKAIHLVSRIHKEFEVKVPLQKIFDKPTISGLLKVINNEEADEFITIQKAPKSDFYPLSSAQRRMYILGEIEEEEISYNMPAAFIIKGHVDQQKLTDTFQKLIERHESFRTTFEIRDDQFVQVIHDDVNLKVDFMDIQESEADQAIADFIQPFDLKECPLLRVALATISENKSILMFDMHHIISDGFSMDILTRDFISLYNGEELAEPAIQYKDYAVWEQEFFQSEQLKKQQDYWVNQFKDDIPVLDLPTDHPRVSNRSLKGATFDFELDSELSQKVRDLAKETDSTYFILLLSAFNILLSKQSGQDDIIVGAPIAGRSHSDLQHTIGVFLNTLAIRNHPAAEKTFTSFLKEVRQSSLGAFEHQDLPFDELLQHLDVQRDVSRNALFDVMFNYQSTENDKVKQISDFEIGLYPRKNTVSKFDLTLEATDNGNIFLLDFEYSTELFNESTIQRYITYFKRILHQICENPSISISEIGLLSEEEKNTLINEFNATEKPYDSGLTLLNAFEKQVDQHTDNVALRYLDSTLSYGELNARVNQLAHHLRAIGVEPNQPVGVMLPRSPQMLISVMAILKAGGAYLPIDPEYPEQRVQYILENSQSQLVIAETASIAGFKGKTILLNDIDLSSQKTENPEPINQPNDLAYIIYTSGSTGNPKGVKVTRQNVVSFHQNMASHFGITEKSNVLAITNLTFDISVLELICTLLSGSTIVLASNEQTADSAELTSLITTTQVDAIQITPSRLTLLIENGELQFLDQVKTLLVGGEPMSQQMYERLLKLRNTTVYNVYGPTETTIWSTYAKLSSDRLTIGRPLANEQVYILSEDGTLCPINTWGEICIGGDGVTAGYLYNEELTSEKFVDDPFGKGAKIYKTGDKGRWLPDGRLDFGGRLDFQVKIRGYRIELGEIENRLTAVEHVKNAVVVDLDDAHGIKYLCAYVVANEEIDAANIKKTLATDLPDYMIPTYIVSLDKIPLNSSGKVNRKALPAPDVQDMPSEEYEAPRNHNEEVMASIWEEVLGIETVGINGNFFQMGGHSLKANLMLSKVHKALGIKIPLREIFVSPTIKQLLASVAGDSQEVGFHEIEKAEVQEYYPLSGAQNRIFVLEQFENTDVSYNLFSALEVKGALDLNAFNNAIQKIVNRHDVLRSSFTMNGDKAVQKIEDISNPTIAYFTANDGDERTIINEFVQPFDLSKAPLFRVGLIKSSDERYIVLFDLHHIVADGVSLAILTEEFIQYYRGEELPALPIQFQDFAVWQEDFFQSEQVQSQYDYWTNRFNDEIPKLVLPYDYPRPAVQQFEGTEYSFSIKKETLAKLKALSNQEEATLYMTLLSAFTVLMSKFGGTEDVLVGSPIAGRPHVDTENLIGMFVNTLVMRNYPEGNKTLRSFLSEVKANALDAYQNQDIPFEEMVSTLDLDRDLSRNALFDVVFVLQNTERQLKASINDLEFSSYPSEHTASKFDLTLTAIETGDSLECVFEYSTKLFKEETVARFGEQFNNVLEGFVQDLDTPISEISVLTDQEKSLLLQTGESVDYPKTETLVSLFEAQSAATPNHIAVTLDGVDLSYKALNERANQFAHLLRVKGVAADTLVALMVDRSMEMIVGIFGILKAGGAYLPIDPDYPQDRIDYTLEDSQCSIVITQEEYKEKISTNIEQLYVNDVAISEQSTENPSPVNKPSDLAYVIYTSGSTGKPKGVMVEHRNAVRLLFTEKPLFDFNDQDVWTMFHSFAFDFSVWEMYGALLFGGKLVMVPKHIAQNPNDFITLLDEQKVTVLNQTPGAFYNLINEEVNREESTLSLRYVIFGGEALAPGRLEKFNKRYPQTKLINMYGITETTVHVTYKEIGEEEIKTNVSNIGKPIPTLTTYVFDDYGKLQPVGVTGEMYVGGEGVARGYLNREELTKERFIVNPYNEKERLYKSGDLAKYLPNGELEYLGRNDFQVKIRGYRIELGEIESKMLAIEGVKEAIVVDRADADGNKYLSAYVVSEEEISVTQFREALGKDLPAYMIPSYFIAIDTIPLTSNGKINKKALPEPEGNIKLDVEYVPPQNEIEELLAEIWQAVLGVPKIGLKEDFFSLGGDSIKAIQISSRLQQHQLRFELKDLFQYSTIGQLSRYVKATNRVIDQGEVVGEIPLTPIYHHFFDHQFEQENHYNQSVMLFSKNGFDEDILKKAFDQIVQHHDALRLKTIKNEGQVELYNQSIEEGSYAFKTFDFANQEEASKRVEKEADKIQRSIDIEKGNLLNLGLFKTTEGDHLLIAIHHLAIDGVSWRILLEDLKTAYKQLSSGEEIKLPLKTDALKHWGEKLVEYAQSDDLATEANYWKSIDEVVPSLPTEEVSSNGTAHKIGVQMELDKERTEQLLKEVNAVYNTEINDILLSALGLAVSKWASINNVFINLEGHGREELFADADISRTIGWFTTIYPVKISGDAQQDISSLIKRNKESIRKIPNKGVGFGVLKYMKPDFTFNARPEITFNYLGQFDEEVSSEVFAMSPFSSGLEVGEKNHMATSLEINGMVAGKRLSLGFSFYEHKFQKEKVQQLANIYRESLETIIDHCVKKEEVEATPSDFTYKELSLEELDDLNDDLMDLLDD